jgi:hypothetical protein
MNRRPLAHFPGLLACAAIVLAAAHGRAATPNLAGHVDRVLRYQPEGGDFVISNGTESFNRPLYGYPSAFRVDAGDRPEFSLYLPGRGGNLRFGIRTSAGAKWLHEADTVVARYRAGSMVYEVHDALLGSAALRLQVVATAETEGLIAGATLTGADTPVDLVWAYGGASGERARRDGDIGTEREPVSRFFALRPEACRDNHFELVPSGFVLTAKSARLAGITPTGAHHLIADASGWVSAQQLLASADPATPAPAVVGHCPMIVGQPLFVALQRLPSPAAPPPASEPADYAVSSRLAAPTTAPAVLRATAYAPADLPPLFERTAEHWQVVARQVTVDTPDAFINAAAPALCVAADGVWDSRVGAFMHGAVAWRVKLLGWRGAYAGDALGQHDRTRRHLDNGFPRQNHDPVPPDPVGPDPQSDLARSENWLHSNGDLTASHYDMNLVAIDALFRHLLWTGDRDYARRTWPVIQRHLAWERRLFRRPFGPDGLPLYEAYACIWASDDLQYSGGGVTHASAYNAYHNAMAARVAEWIGEDPAPYRQEADLIRQAMQRELWLSDRGWFAEYKDVLGRQLVHPAAGLWTHYHTIDSAAADPLQAWQMGRYVDTQIPHFPLRGAGLPPGCYTLSTTSWMPYTWSINNVVMAETVHTALADFQAQRDDRAFAELKGALLDSMYAGLCPGNVGMATSFDAYRRESQRDFADAVGITSRTLVEGLFGIKPDAISGELLIRPGFPPEWDHASIGHPDVNFSYRRDGRTDTYIIEPRFPRPMRLRLRLPAKGTQVATVTVSGRPASWSNFDDSIARPRIDVVADAAARWEVTLQWDGANPTAQAASHTSDSSPVQARDSELQRSFAPATLVELADPQHALSDVTRDKDSLRARATGTSGHRTVFARVRQGDLLWWQPLTFEIRPPLENVDTTPDGGPARFRVRNNTDGPIGDNDATVIVNHVARPIHLAVAARGVSDDITLDDSRLAPGTNAVSVTLGSLHTPEGLLARPYTGTTAAAAAWQTVPLDAVFNDRVTRIFKNTYLSPRSPYCSLSIPTDGLGGWATFKATADIDDTGLRAASGKNGGRLLLPNGLPFLTPASTDAPNIAFVSQWDNHPHELTLPLSGKAAHAYFLIAGSTNAMQSRLDNGEVVITYADGTAQRLALHNPTTWWPIEQDYFIDDYAFAGPTVIPPRVHLKTGTVRLATLQEMKGSGGPIPGGAATVLDLPLDPSKELRSVTVRALANEVVIGLMSLTLQR